MLTWVSLKFKITSDPKYGKITLLICFQILILQYSCIHRPIILTTQYYYILAIKNFLNHHPQSYWYIHSYRVQYILNWNLHTCIYRYKIFLQLHFNNSQHVFNASRSVDQRVIQTDVLNLFCLSIETRCCMKKGLVPNI